MIGPHWDQEAVASRFEEAVDVLARLPDEQVRGMYDLWPKLVGEPCRHARPAAAVPEAIDRMDEACPGNGSRIGWGSAAPRRGSAGLRLSLRSWSG
jgi:hypothetical protein